MTRIFRSGACFRSRSTAARVSRVGTSPQQPITTSGSPPRSLLAHSQIPSPASQCLTASFMVSHCGAGCLPATMTFVVAAAEAMVGHGQQAVGVGWQVDADDLRLLVDDVVNEPRVLM